MRHVTMLSRAGRAGAALLAILLVSLTVAGCATSHRNHCQVATYNDLYRNDHGDTNYLCLDRVHFPVGERTPAYYHW